MRHSDLSAEVHVISLDLFGYLILTEMSLAEPGLCNGIQQTITTSSQKVWWAAGPHACRKLPHCAVAECCAPKVIK